MVTTKHRIARALIRLIPVDLGIWRAIRWAPSFRDPSLEPIEVKLRGLPLRMRVRLQTYVGRFIFYRGMYEESPIRILRRLLRPGANFVDVGANIGLYSLVAAHCVGPSGRVIAVEPQKRVAELLSANIALNGLNNVTVANLALAEKAGEGQIHQVSYTSDADATLQMSPHEVGVSAPETVRLETLSALLAEHNVSQVEGLKVDVEGAELSVLGGFLDWLATRPPRFILFECIDSNQRRFGKTGAELIQFFLDHGYEVRCNYRFRWRRLLSPRDHARFSEATDFLAIRPDQSPS